MIWKQEQGCPILFLEIYLPAKFQLQPWSNTTAN